MAKPILFLRYNENLCFGTGGRSIPAAEMMGIMQEKFVDYHVLATPSEQVDGELFDLQVFSEKDFTEVQYAELKQMIEDSIKIKTNNK